jgi:AcrR family transcriptional regulator
MPDVRAQLLERVVAEVAANGLADRSLRDLAEAVGSSHRMLLYHFGSRAGLVAAIVESTEAAQRALLAELAHEVEDPAELVRALWARVSAPEMLPFVRLFFECVGLTGGERLTDPWLAVSATVGRQIGLDTNEDELRLGVAVTRGLLIDVLATGDAGPATRSLERFLEMWAIGQPRA